MTAHDPRVTLTEVETDLLGPFIWGGGIGVVEDKRAAFSEELRATVEQIIAARLAPIRAILDAWDAWDGSPGPDGRPHPDSSSPRDRERLRKALDAPQDAPRGPVGGEQGTEVAGGRSEDDERAWLIALCERGVVPEGRWRNRDTADAQRQLGEALALLRAGCSFRIAESPESDERTLWVLITFKGFAHFEGDDELDEELFYIPTEKRLEARDGDWY